MMNHLFKTMGEFANERGVARLVYNSRSAYVASRSLNVISAQGPWAKAKSESDVDVWKAESPLSTSEGGKVYTSQWYLS